MARTPALAHLADLFADDARTTRREALRASAGAALAASAFGAMGCGGDQTAKLARRPPPAPARRDRGRGPCRPGLRARAPQAGRARGRLRGERAGSADAAGRSATSSREGQIAEHGGELIDSGHTHIRALAAELGLRLDNVNAAEAPGTRQTLYFDGAVYPDHQAALDIAQIRPALKRDLHAAGYPTLYDHHNAAGARLDHLSISDWVAANVPPGGAPRVSAA